MSYDYHEIKDENGNVLYYTEQLDKQTYGNGDYNEFIYDDEQRITNIKINNQIRFNYQYDYSGNLSVYTEYDQNSQIKETLTYHYDSLG